LYGILGPDHADSAEPVAIALPAPAEALWRDNLVACAVISGVVHCWGDNGVGSLGRGAESASLDLDPVPRSVELDDEIATVTMAWGSVCALSVDGRIYCWGPGGGLFGPSDDHPWEVPRRVEHLEPARAIALRYDGGGLCVIGTDDVVRCHVQDPVETNPPTAVEMHF
jgi:hypothetical protein